MGTVDAMESVVLTHAAVQLEDLDCIQAGWTKKVDDETPGLRDDGFWKSKMAKKA